MSSSAAYPSETKGDEKKLFMFRHLRDASMKLISERIRELADMEPTSLVEMKETLRDQIVDKNCNTICGNNIPFRSLYYFMMLPKHCSNH